jgi:peptidoglycan/xylan/chitin deacetylase (PgdA/CDA1 family)
VNDSQRAKGLGRGLPHDLDKAPALGCVMSGVSVIDLSPPHGGAAPQPERDQPTGACQEGLGGSGGSLRSVYCIDYSERFASCGHCHFSRRHRQSRLITLRAMPPVAQPHDQRSQTVAAVPPSEVGSAPGWPVVLYFHHVHPELRHYTAVTPTSFDRALGKLGEHFLPLEPRAVPSVLEIGGHPKPTCLLTFDDGYADVYDHALPIMERRGWHCVVFVSMDLIGCVEYHATRGPLRHMTWAQLEELARRGHVVASHGCGHIALNRLNPAAAQGEIDRARHVLEERLPGSPDWLAYPFGELPGPGILRLPSLCFGSIKAPARAWDAAPHEIRRTYLPADDRRRWSRCMTGWSQAWKPSTSR